MRDFDLKPGEYKERKPDGWRWKLPWSHPQDTKLPMVMCLVCLAVLAAIFFNLPTLERVPLFIGSVVFAFGAGGMFILWLGRD